MMKILTFPEPASTTNVGATAERRLHESPYFFLKGIRCSFDCGVLTLRGSVPLWQLKQFAEAIAARVEGVKYIDNQVQVADPEEAGLSVRAARNAG
jgi:osmotically-inducible protein OsmY